MTKRPFIGSAVVKGKIRFTSVSQIKLFDPKSDGCPRKWGFQYVLGKKLQKTSALTTGIDLDEKTEHYLRTGENVLPPTLQPLQKFMPLPGPDLELQEPFGDIEKAVYFRDKLLEPGSDGIVGELMQRMQRFAGLTACGIPLEGAPDIRHRRGEYIDEEGVLRSEAQGAIVVETADQKVISRIWTQTTGKGQVLQGWAKTSAQVCEDAQMLGYAKAATQKYPDATHHRLSHLYAQKSSRGATKRTGLISVAQVLERWHGVEQVVGQMVQAATATKIEDLQPNYDACDSFTHIAPDGTQQKGCGHRYYCPRGAEIFQNMLSTSKESSMSLFDTLDPAALGLPPSLSVPAPAPAATSLAPALNATQERALIEAEKARLLAQDNGCGRPGCGVGCARGWVKGEGPGAFLVCECARITPSDAPPPAPLLQAAAPLPPAAVAEISDPALRQKVEAHAAEHRRLEEAHAEAEQAAKVAAGTNVWCAESSKRLTLTMEMALSRKYVCSCTKTITLKPAKQADGSYEATLPRHKPANRQAAEAPAVPATTPAAPAAPIVVEAPPAPPIVELLPAKTNGANGHNHKMSEQEPSVVELLKSIDMSLRELVTFTREGRSPAASEVKLKA